MGLSQGGSVAIGILVGLASTSIQSLGLTLQRKSHLLEDEKDENVKRRPPYRRRRWQIGMSMFVIANLVGSTIQITTLPLPVLSTLQASGLVFNTICATLILGEPFTRWSFIGTVLVAGGAMLIAVFGSLSEDSHTLQQHLLLLARHQFLLWLFGTLLVVVIILVVIWFLDRIKIRGRLLTTKRRLLTQGLAYGAVSGILSAHTLLIAKSAVELLVRTIVDKINQFNRWQSWLILLALLVFALSQLYYLHRGLKLTSTSVLYPFVFCVYNVIAILDGLIYFKQVSRLAAWRGGLIAVGTAILLGGVVALSWRLEDHPTQHRDPDENMEHEVPTIPAKMGFPPPKPAIGPGLGFSDPDPTHPDRLENQSFDLESGERSPLLQQRRHSAQGGRPSVSRARRMTLASTPRHEANAEIWNELNDRGEVGVRDYGTQGSSGGVGSSNIVHNKRTKRRSLIEPDSPQAKRSPRQSRMPKRSATMPLHGTPASGSGGASSWVGNLLPSGNLVPRNPVEWLTGGRRTTEGVEDDETAPAEVDEDEPLMGRGHGRSVSDVSRRRRKSGAGSWFRLGWFRRGDG